MTDWDELDRRYGRKVGYRSGRVMRTAYLDTPLGGDRYSGTEKHSDTPVTVQWTGSEYVQVDE